MYIVDLFGFYPRTKGFSLTFQDLYIDSCSGLVVVVCATFRKLMEPSAVGRYGADIGQRFWRRLWMEA